MFNLPLEVHHTLALLGYFEAQSRYSLSSTLTKPQEIFCFCTLVIDLESHVSLVCGCILYSDGTET